MSSDADPRNVTAFSYRYNHGQPATILASFQTTKGVDKKIDAAAVLDNLTCEGFDSVDLTPNELARTHMQHLAGGRATVKDERLLRFEFPEKPGALHLFLEKLYGSSKVGVNGHGSWNVSAFHYRNHGADFGRVLVGIQVPCSEYDQFDAFLKSLDYTYHEETDNEVYKDFMLERPEFKHPWQES